MSDLLSGNPFDECPFFQKTREQPLLTRLTKLLPTTTINPGQTGDFPDISDPNFAQHVAKESIQSGMVSNRIAASSFHIVRFMPRF